MLDYFKVVCVFQMLPQLTQHLLYITFNAKYNHNPNEY